MDYKQHQILNSEKVSVPLSNKKMKKQLRQLSNNQNMQNANMDTGNFAGGMQSESRHNDSTNLESQNER